MTFDELYKRAAGFRRVSSELRPLVAFLDAAIAGNDAAAVRVSLITLLEFLSSERGRTDANCCVVDAFFGTVDASMLPEDLRAVVSDLSGTLHETIFAPQ